MSLRLGDLAPNFQAKTTVGDIDFYEYIDGSWAVYIPIHRITHLFAPQSSEGQLS